MEHIEIENKIIGAGQPVFIIAEAGVNHNGDLKTAKKLVDVAMAAGADAVKFQTFTAELVVTSTAEQAEYQTKNIGKKESHFAMLKRLELPREFHPIIQKYCKKKGIIFLSTPFSESDADFLETLNVPAYKFSSGDLNNIPFLKHVAKKGKPMIIATGMANLAETRQAVQAVLEEGNDQIIILHSTSNYPPSPSSLNLHVITTLWKELGGIPVGYSDNGSEGNSADIIAVALGACVLEKHFTLDKNMTGPDHKASLDPQELRALVKAIRDTELMLGSFEKKCSPEEEPTRAIARKSIVAKKTISPGKIITNEDVIVKRPGTGIPPTELALVIGKKACQTIVADTIISWKDIV